MILLLMTKWVVGNIRRVKHQRRKLLVLKPIRLRVKHPTIWQKGICGVARYTIGLCCSNRQVWTNMNGLRGPESIAATSTTSKKRKRAIGRASSRERVGQCVYITMVGASLKNKAIERMHKE